MDDKRVTVDLNLRTSVLDRIAERHHVSMLDLVYMFATFAISMKLPPLSPTKKEVLSGDVFEGESIYQLVSIMYETDEPRKIAHELANAGMDFVKDLPLDELELAEVFRLSSD